MINLILLLLINVIPINTLYYGETNITSNSYNNNEYGPKSGLFLYSISYF